MTCAAWNSRLSSYVDAELPSDEMEAFRAHAAQCPECASAAMTIMEAKATLRRAGRRYEAPANLRARVLADAIDSGRRNVVALTPTKPRSLNWTRWAMAAAVLLLAAG